MMKWKSLLAAFALLVLWSAPPARAWVLKSRHTQDYFSTVCVLTLYMDSADEEAFEALWARVKGELAAIEQAVSLRLPTSDISRFNALSYGESCRVSAVTADILGAAFEMYEETGGLYDPTVYPLVDLWGFSPRFNSGFYAPAMPYDREYVQGRLPMPEERYIQAFKGLVGLENIQLSGDTQGWTLRKGTEPVSVDGVLYQGQIDLGGIAKGYACDRVASILREEGYGLGHFVCGGSSMAILRRPGESGLYELTMGKPRAGLKSESHYAKLLVSDTALSSSDDASHCFVRDGVVYSHIIDPRSGWPVNTPTAQEPQRGIAAVTVLGESAQVCDALSTALMVMGAQKAMETIGGFEDVTATMVLYQQDRNQYEVVTNVAEDTITIVDPAYRAASMRDGQGRLQYTGSIFEAPDPAG